MPVDNVQSTLNQIQNETTRLQFEQGRKNLGTSNIGKDAFLQLLLAQLKYQDPTNPVSNTEFVSQQAQFTQIEKLDNLNTTLQNSNQLSQASSLAGKTVVVKDQTGAEATGKIDSIEIGTNGTIGLQIAGKTYTPNQIIKILSN